MSGRIPKPLLRGAASAYTTRAVPTSIIAGLLAACAWKWGYAEPSKRAYAEFYSKFDADADFERMDGLGLFHIWDEVDADDD